MGAPGLMRQSNRCAPSLDSGLWTLSRPSFSYLYPMSNNNPSDPWTDRWNERYSQEAFAYGEEPNQFLKEQLSKLQAGKILFPAEGEGRNAVHAALNGWAVTAFDISSEGKKKALQLAGKHGVNIDYMVGPLEELQFEKASFDAIALIYAHFPAHLKSGLHKALSELLKPGGTILFEAFSKGHLAYNSVNEKVGGPKDIDSLFSIEEIKADFPNFEIIILEEKEIELSEGNFHNGNGLVVRFIGKKR